MGQRNWDNWDNGNENNNMIQISRRIENNSENNTKVRDRYKSKRTGLWKPQAGIQVNQPRKVNSDRKL